MKARYRGVEVEGTPHEVALFVKLLAPPDERGQAWIPPHTKQPTWTECNSGTPGAPMEGEAHT